MDENACWEAVLARDARYDGVFYTAVKTTGVYCRPSCPGRHPLRKNVTFFETPDAAEQAGFRPCKRCRPRETARPQADLVQRVCDYLVAHLDERISLEALSQEFNLSPYHLQRTFKKAMGISPRAYQEARRLEQFKTQVRSGDTVTGALYEVGYSSSSRLYDQTPLGMTPAVYRNGGKDMQIGYTLVDSQLGRLLVAATQRGVCAVYLGDSDQPLEAALTKEYPEATIHRMDSNFSAWVNAILSYLDGKQPQLDLPLDVQATAFQRQVWQALQTIPYGETRTYEEIAESVGKPKAARAVGHACATNPVSMVIPCHRVVRSNGELGGYRWGLDRKAALLKTEQEHVLAG